MPKPFDILTSYEAQSLGLSVPEGCIAVWCYGFGREKKAKENMRMSTPETMFEPGKLFVWGSTIYRATTACDVTVGSLSGSQEILLEFNDIITLEQAQIVATALGADCRYMMLGSDSGMDDGAVEEEEES
jgi:hypothetical protein